MLDSNASRLVRRWMGISSLALIAATYRLWTPQTVFPQIPAIELLCSIPRWLDWCVLASLVVGVCLLTFSRGERWIYLGCYVGMGSLIATICLDQHRFQPWAHQLGIFLFVWLTCPIRLQHLLIRWLMISIYFFSALGKLDYEFLHSVGQSMLGAIAKLLGQDADTIPSGTRVVLIAMFPLIELSIALGLAWPKSRYFAGWLAIGLHLSLLVILGPLGLNHRPSVLVWNVQFAVLAFLLFIRTGQQSVATPTEEPNTKSELRNRFPTWLQCSCASLIGIVMIMPATERFGVWDHWPSWALYAPHSSRVRVEVSGPGLSRLPAELVQLTDLTVPANEEILGWINVPIDRWSLQSLDTPIYPQARFQLGVARQIVGVVDSEPDIRVILLGCSNRFNGQRSSEVLQDNAQLEKAASQYWLNTRPRN
ncbi:MAG: hypothetical protein LW870_16490 [Pirellula sp.]|jgi:hypothetical protein|nr:hypothetical protein [Pirellula sp.]